MYVYISGPDDVFDDAHFEIDPNFFLTTQCDFEGLELISNLTFIVGGFETNHLRNWRIYEYMLQLSAPKCLCFHVNWGW